MERIRQRLGFGRFGDIHEQISDSMVWMAGSVWGRVCRAEPGQRRGDEPAAAALRRDDQAADAADRDGPKYGRLDEVTNTPSP